jgi:hypothetical protein
MAGEADHHQRRVQKGRGHFQNLLPGQSQLPQTGHEEFLDNLPYSIRAGQPTCIPGSSRRIEAGWTLEIRAAHIPCYSQSMEKSRQNVTLVLDEDLLLAARKVALDQRTSVNQLVREYLSALVEEPSRKRLAQARLSKAFETGLVDVGDRNWSRDDLYER